MSGEAKLMDLFAGCGGLTSGFVSTGRFAPIAAVEWDLHAAATYAQNFGDHIHVGDIADWTRGSLPQADVVVGGPPCQGFSSLGTRDPQDPRNAMWEHYVETLERVRPAFFVMENVPQFLKSTQFAELTGLVRARGRLGAYEIEMQVVNAADHGAAQARRRAVVIGRRRGTREIGLPELWDVRSLSDAFPAWLAPRVTKTELPDSVVEFRGRTLPGPFKMRDLHITRDVSDLSRARYAAIPPGGNRFDLPDELSSPCWRRHRSGSGDVMGRLRWDRPSVTIRTEFFKPEKGRYLHPTEDRPITHAEAASIQGFPEDFEWCGTKVSIARQIGNAVPPPLARSIATVVADRLA
ncbi:DNA cytosine methyltransferase [Nocardioides scoriae]|uniref:DNA cytosine methyltransferase n=1 Tax=Nocardioides scoriae TaxID=642780 RepID=UPI0018D3CFC6|nr:DNA cytosine methyltransferase [Nocardioides scoriae]